MTAKKLIVILTHAFVGWMLCGATIAIGRTLTTLQNTLVIHAIGTPIYFFFVSMVYAKRFNYTTPLQTAVIFLSFIIVMDFFVVALMINRSLEMFTSLIGTWIPFALIFGSTYLTMRYSSKRSEMKEKSKCANHC